MKIQRAHEHRVMPWKNGGGATTEIVLSPAGATLETFDWRVSMATVGSDGPFSAFPGIDRSISILEGDGLHLEVTGCRPVTLTLASEPYCFPGDVPTAARLIDRPVVDLNVMTRRSGRAMEVTRVSLQAGQSLSLPTTLAVLLCHSGQVSWGTDTLGPLDAILYEDSDVTSGQIVAGSASVVFLIAHPR